jgi:hypothetical protein
MSRWFADISQVTPETLEIAYWTRQCHDLQDQNLNSQSENLKLIHQDNSLTDVHSKWIGNSFVYRHKSSL